MLKFKIIHKECLVFKLQLKSSMTCSLIWFIYIACFCCFHVIFCSPCDRNLRDVELISCRLRRVEPLCRLPGSALQQLAMCGFYEDLEKGVTRE